MNTNPFVSIIILSYNGAAYLENCLDSVENQDYPRDRFEIIVADNGSTDNSVNLLKTKYKDAITLLEYGTNHGFAKGNNLAVKHSKSDLLVFLNQDTVVHRQWLSALVKGVAEGNFDVCHSNMLFPRNEEFQGVHNKEFPKNIYYYELTRYGYVSQIVRSFIEDIVETKAIAGGSFIIKRDALNKVGYLFDERFGMYNEDTDLALRLSQKGLRIGIVPSSVVYHFTKFEFRITKYNIWKNLIMIRNRMFAFWKALERRDFIRILPYLIVSQSHKVYMRSEELKYGFLRSFFLACSVFPLSLISFLWFIVSIPTDTRLVHNKN